MTTLKNIFKLTVKAGIIVAVAAWLMMSGIVQVKIPYRTYQVNFEITHNDGIYDLNKTVDNGIKYVKTI